MSVSACGACGLHYCSCWTGVNRPFPVHPTGFGDALAQVSIPGHCSGLTAVFCHSILICSSLHSLILLIDHVASHTPLNKFQTVHPGAPALQVLLPLHFLPCLLLPQSSQIWPPNILCILPHLFCLPPVPLLAQLVGNARLSSTDLLSSIAQQSLLCSQTFYRPGCPETQELPG